MSHSLSLQPLNFTALLTNVNADGLLVLLNGLYHVRNMAFKEL